MKKLLALGVIAGSMFVASAAQAACWTERAAEAAQVRQFETMLMVSALRCRLKGIEFLPQYNQFIRDKRAALTGVNDELRAQFSAGTSPRAGLDAYDRYVTSVANSFGAGVEGLACEDMASLMDAANAMPASRDALVTLTLRAGVEADLPGGICQVTQIASAQIASVQIAPGQAAHEPMAPAQIAMAQTTAPVSAKFGGTDRMK